MSQIYSEMFGLSGKKQKKGKAQGERKEMRRANRMSQMTNKMNVQIGKEH